MKALSILQPWAWLIVRPDIVGEIARLEAYRAGEIKDIENRTWWPTYRGRFLVHAGKKYGPRIHDEYAEAIDDMFKIKLPPYNEIPRGGIIGDVELIGYSRSSESRWASDGQYHFRLANARPRPFTPYIGQLGFFEIPESVAPWNIQTSAPTTDR